MPKRYSTVRGREFGEGVRAAISQAGMTSRQLADLLGWQEAKVSDMVNGKGGVTLLEIAVVLGACRVPEAEREHLLSLFPVVDEGGWWQPHGRCAPVRSRTAMALLAEAETSVSWHPHAIPALLQTDDYARRLIAASATLPAAELDDRLCVLHEMQELLHTGLDCTFYLHELALELEVGGREEHITQLHHLLRMASWSRIRVLIVPAWAGAHAGIAGPFTQLTFPKYQPLIWTTTENSSLFAEAEHAVKGYQAVVRALDEISLDEDQSSRLISGRCVRLQELDAAEDLIRDDEPFPPVQ
ncbi:helix-turn-helix domain-containing protein [Lentzea cavernae]|uniref:Transcriptional regulator n=1 Tax=Lentzea cavernae TaxID=2020703 RepID=A0ABQ3MED3_9PSEU|nr:helix-turn-helix transcriptional regulator [Lentzea cavernae]GHH42040.1 transcriptional regulator [Lentzea cavernae]